MYIHIYIYILYIYSILSCSVVFRHVPSCSVMFRRVPSCSVVFRRVPLKNEQNRRTSVNNRIVETGPPRLLRLVASVTTFKKALRPYLPGLNPPSSSKLERVRNLSYLLPYHYSPTSSPLEASSHHSPTSSPPEASKLDASNLLVYLFIGGGISCNSLPQAATGRHRLPQVVKPSRPATPQNLPKSTKIMLNQCKSMKIHINQ